MNSTFRRLSVLETMALALLASFLYGSPQALAALKQDPDNCSIDLREYQHGIDFVPRPNGQYYLFWSVRK